MNTSCAHRPGLSGVGGAFRIMLTRIAREKALPFEPLVPNEKTVAAMREARKGKLKRFDNVDSLMASHPADGCFPAFCEIPDSRLPSLFSLKRENQPFPHRGSGTVKLFQCRVGVRAFQTLGCRPGCIE